MPRKKRVNKLFTLDTETIGLGGDIKRVAIYDGEQLHYGYKFGDVEHVLDEAYKEGYNPRVYIHNLEFDIRKIGIFRDGNVNWNQTVLINDKYARITCRHYTLHDSFKILPMSLYDASSDFQLEHGKLDLWEEVQKSYPGQYETHVDFLNRCHPDNELYIKYLGFDTIALYELMEKLMELSGLSLDEMVNRVSTASLSKYILRTGYKGEPFKGKGQRKTDYEHLTSYKAWSSSKPSKYAKPVKKFKVKKFKVKKFKVKRVKLQRDFAIPKNLKSRMYYSYLELEKKIRQGYYGGRTEVFTPLVTNGGAYHFDINSMYPAQFLKEYPVGEPDYYNKPGDVEGYWKMWLDSHNGMGFITAQVYIPQQHIPPLPAKMGKLVFPTGHIRGTWTFHELEYAIKNCGVEIKNFEELFLFRQTFPVFKRFVEKFYPMKTEGKITGNKAQANFAKLILNTGYGWTCLSRENKSELKDISKREQYADRLNYTDEELGFINIESLVVSDSVQVPVGAYVASYARVQLLDMLRKMDEIGTVYYCDTDSIVCSESIPAELIHPTELGKWDLEATIKDGSMFLFPKVYYEMKEDEKKPETIKFKGVSRDTQKTFDRAFYSNILEKLQHGGKDEIVVEKGKELLRSVLYTQKRGIDINTVEYRDKKVKLSNIQKRNIDYKNNTSMPWYFESLKQFEQFTFSEPIKKWEEHGNVFNPFSLPPKKREVKRNDPKTKTDI